MKPNLMMIALRCSLVILIVVAPGCKDRGIALPTAPVAGKVTYQGKPLGFGTVTFFHPSGHAASAKIAADGTFTLNAYQGKNQVSIECFESDRPGSTKVRSRDMSDNKSLIPDRYANYSTSGLTFEVKAEGNDKAEFTLKD
jgi:hypothetical protein